MAYQRTLIGRQEICDMPQSRALRKDDILSFSRKLEFRQARYSALPYREI